MSDDINYFSETRMDAGDAVDFYNNLPNRRLQTLFEEAISDTPIWKDSCHVLKHYRISSDYGGVKAIEFKFDTTAHVNWIPLAGTVYWLGKKVVAPSPNAYIYFDSSTGEMLNKNEAQSRRRNNNSAETHFQNGKHFEGQEKYQQAYEEYKQAYQECSREYRNENMFLQYRDRAKDEADSNALREEAERELACKNLTSALNKFKAALNKTNKNKQFIEKRIQFVEHEIFTANEQKVCQIIKKGNQKFVEMRYTEALEYYQQAKLISKDRKNQSLIDEQIKSTRTEIRACNFKEEGDRLFNAGQFQTALEKYLSAYHTANVATKTTQYANLVSLTRTELTIIDKINSAQSFLKNGDFKSAEREIMSAKSMTTSTHNKTKCKNIVKEIKMEMDILKTKKMGDTAFKKGNYSEAYEYFTSAFLTTKNTKMKEIYGDCLDSTKYEIDAIAIHEQAKVAFQAKNYQQAIDLLNSAIKKSKQDLNRQRIRQDLNDVQHEYTIHQKNEAAERYFTKGQFFESKGNFKDAYEEYNKALQKCSNNYFNKSVFTMHEKKIKIELDSDELRQKGDRELARGNLQSALNKFQAALDKTKQNKQIMKKKVEFVRNEILAAAVKEEGDALFAEGSYARALEKYSSAWNECKCSDIKSTYALLMRKTKDELSVIDVFQKGNAAFEAGDYVKAKKYFSKAYSGTKSDRTKDACKEILHLTNTELDAVEIQQKALNILENNDYEEAIVLLMSAVTKSKHKLNQQKIQMDLDFVKNELDVKQIIVKAIQLFDGRKYVKAAELYKEARDKATQKKRCRKLAILQQQCINEANAQNLAKEGDELYKQSNLLQALKKYQKALEISNVQIEINKYAAFVTKVLIEANTSAIERVNELTDNFDKETNSVFDEVYRLISALKGFHAVNETSELIENLRKHFDSCVNKLDAIHPGSDDVIEEEQISGKNMKREELLNLIKSHINEGTINKLEEAGTCILDLLNKYSDQLYIELKDVLVVFDKTGAEDEFYKLKQKFQEHFQNYIDQVNSIQIFVSNNQPDLTSHYQERAYEQADKQQEPVVVLNYQYNNCN